MRRRTLLLLVVAGLATGCSDHSGGKPVSASGDRRGLDLRMTLSATGDSLVIETRVSNKRGEAVHVVSDQCGRITEVVVARTRFEPTGRIWGGSLQAVKRLILADQRSQQDPDRFQPRRPGDTSSRVPPCRRPERPLTLRAGDSVDERWELPFKDADALDAVGSAGSVVRAEVVEARDPSEPEFLDMLPTGEADAVRRGRRLRLERPASRVVERPVSARREPSPGQLYDRLLADRTLWRWLAAQPVDSWREAQLWATPGGLRFKAITTRYERAVAATARPDATGVETHVPGRSDLSRTWVRRRATLPPGIHLIRQREGWSPTKDVVAEKVGLPSGRIVVGEYLLEERPLRVRARPGRYAVHATLARYEKERSDSVALATLVLSNRPTSRWEQASAIAVDGGTAVITSAEAAAAIRAAFDRSQERWERLSEEMFDSLTAHDYQVTEFALGRGLNLAQFSSGLGDGRYPVFVGFDAEGRPTRVVIDFLLLRLDWP
jgi:hypothetical protein